MQTLAERDKEWGLRLSAATTTAMGKVTTWQPLLLQAEIPPDESEAPLEAARKRHWALCCWSWDTLADLVPLMQLLAACDRALRCCHILWFPTRAEATRQLQALMCQYSSNCMETLQLQFSFHLR